MSLIKRGCEPTRAYLQNSLASHILSVVLPPKPRKTYDTQDSVHFQTCVFFSNYQLFIPPPPPHICKGAIRHTPPTPRRPSPAIQAIKVIISKAHKEMGSESDMPEVLLWTRRACDSSQCEIMMSVSCLLPGSLPLLRSFPWMGWACSLVVSGWCECVQTQRGLFSPRLLGSEALTLISHLHCSPGKPCQPLQ